jgi:hypothetical protein
VSPLDIPCKYPIAFWVTAAVISLYHAVRAVLNQRRWVADENIRRQASQPPLEPWSLWEQIIIHRAHDFLFHIVCSVSGFVSAWAFAAMFKNISIRTDIGAGTAILMSFLAIVAVAGIAGVLPPLLLYGRLWGKVSGQSK